MGVYIKGMEMPKSCMLCSFCVPEADEANGEMCMVTGKLMPPCNHERLDDCPIVPVPPHGRLIDRDALIKELEITEEDDHNGATLLMAVFLEVLKSAPTIIPAEEGET